MDRKGWRAGNGTQELHFFEIPATGELMKNLEVTLRYEVLAAVMQTPCRSMQVAPGGGCFRTSAKHVYRRRAERQRQKKHNS